MVKIVTLQVVSILGVVTMYLFFEELIYPILGVNTDLIKVDSYALRDVFKKAYPYKMGLFVLNMSLNLYLCILFIQKKDSFKGQAHTVLYLLNLMIGLLLLMTTVLGIFSQRRWL